MNDGDLTNPTPAATGRRMVDPHPTDPTADGHVSGCELEVGFRTKQYTATFQVSSYQGLDRVLDLLMAETLDYNPWLCVWPAISPRPHYADNYLRVDLNVSGGVGAIRYTSDREGCTGSWLTKTSRPVREVRLFYDYHTGEDSRFPDDAIIPLELWRQALHEYLDLRGGRPRSVGWQPTEFRW